MAYPLGKAPQQDGTGHTPEDMQRVLWGLYVGDAPLIVRGCEVTGIAFAAPHE